MILTDSLPPCPCSILIAFYYQHLALNNSQVVVGTLVAINLISRRISIAVLFQPLGREELTHDHRPADVMQSSTRDKAEGKLHEVKGKAKDGAITLTGTVSEESHKSLAAETVANLPNVKSVENNLEAKGEKHAEKSDAWLTAKIKTTLLFHCSVSGIKTEVDVKNGIVTLRGDADNQAQKDLATEYAKDIEGVKDVKNVMNVTKTAKEIKKETRETRTAGDKIDDASITPPWSSRRCSLTARPVASRPRSQRKMVWLL
jgi:osmotically-inducible protein OsmY